MNEQENPQAAARGNYVIGAIIAIALFLLVGVIVYARSQNPPSGTVCPEPVTSTQDQTPGTTPDTSQQATGQEQTAQTGQIDEAVQDTPQHDTGIPRFLDLGTTTCRPCRMMIPVMDELRAEFAGKLQVDFINVAENQTAGQQYNVRSIPLQIFFDSSGKELFRHVGFWSKQDIINKWKELGYDLE